MYVHSLTINNLRSFHKASVEFIYPGSKRAPGSKHLPTLRNVNVILGTNGSGKSTVLDAMALSLLSPLIASSGYRPYALIRRSSRGVVKLALVEADVFLDEQDVSTGTGKHSSRACMRVAVERRGDVEFVRPEETQSRIFDSLYVDESPAFFFVGYGATRRVDIEAGSEAASRRKLRHPRYERVASLFEDHFSLAPLSSWLPEWRHRDPERYRDVVQLLGKLLPKGVKFKGEIENGEYLFSFHSTVVPFGALSDGYRAYIGWISDLLQHLCVAAKSGARLIDCRGVVMVDEIDLHIHPEWQLTIIPTLAKTLKNLQFIFTTHSPLVVGTLQRENVLVVERKRGFPVVSRPDEEVFGLTSDQILRSELFGLPSTRDAGFKRELDQLAHRAQGGDSEAAMLYMRRASRGAGAIEAEGADRSGEDHAPDWLRQLVAKKG
jgi:energy-coupling factor transporter ATP-binding protein EcfA2